MKNLLIAAMAVVGFAFSSCKTPTNSSVKDIGMVNTQTANTKVLYSDQNKVYLKVCKPPFAPPLTRNCPSDEEPKYLELDYYIFKLPYDVGPYQRDAQGLSLVQKALSDAQKAVAGGNQNAVPTVNRLTSIKLNLEKMLKLRDDLAAQRRDLTYYEYQEEFPRLLSPFGDAAGGNADMSLPANMTFVLIPKGSFVMGSPPSEAGRDDDETQHNVTLTKDFFMQTTEVTQEQWYNVMGNNPSKFKLQQFCPGDYKQSNGIALCPNNPVEQVSWKDVQLFIQKMNDKRDGYTYRLPTAAEWEYAARAGTTGMYSFTGNIDEFAWYNGNSGGMTHPVGRLKPNSFGLYDMAGNLSESTSDFYYGYSTFPVTDPVGPSFGNKRVTRGCSWWHAAVNCRTAKFWADPPETNYDALGFRLVRTFSP